MNHQSLIDALERELAGYIRRGLTARAEAVRQELRRLGSSVDEPQTASEVVPPESSSTSTTMPRRTKKPSEAPKTSEASKTPSRRRKAAP